MLCRCKEVEDAVGEERVVRMRENAVAWVADRAVVDIHCGGLREELAFW